MLSPAHAAKKITSWDDVSDQKARESQWGKAVLDSVPEQTTSVILLRIDINRRLLIYLDVGQITCFFTVVIGTNL